MKILTFSVGIKFHYYNVAISSVDNLFGNYNNRFRFVSVDVAIEQYTVRQNLSLKYAFTLFVFKNVEK